MRRTPNTPHHPRAFGHRFVIVAGSAALLVGCTTAASRLTGVDPEHSKPTTCIGYCNDLYASLVGQEQKLREVNLGECRVLPQPERGACLEEEGARHAAEMSRLEQLRAACLNTCAKGASAG
jgi:hypothetical protein